jgi:tetratricopeptide (TPR) repeat protein
MSKRQQPILPHPLRTSISARAVIPGLGIDVPELQQARALWQANRFDESLSLFEKAVRKYPQNLLALVDASRALGARFEIAKAEGLLDRLIDLGRRNAQILHLAGQSYRMIFRPEKALDCFRRALTINNGIADAHLELAVLYERRHRIEEAFASVEQCLRCAPDYREAHLLKARLLRRRNEESAAATIFRSLAANEQVHPLARAQAWGRTGATPGPGQLLR